MLYFTRHGEIAINSISTICNHNDVKIFEIDCATKYPEYAGSDHGDEENSLAIYLQRSKNTPEPPDPNLSSTEIIFIYDEDENWFPIINCGRYTIIIVLYKKA